MFSRSDKTEDAVEAFGEPATERSPMVLAALAGLLAIAGAFLLVFYLRGGDETAQPAADGTPASASQGNDGAANEADRSVLVVTATIPRGTSVRELIEAPTVYLSARAVPEQFVAASAITSVAELAKFDGQVLASDALPGEQLLEGRFIDPSSFDNPSLLEAVTVVDAPPGHHLVVVPLPAARALGGNIGAGDVVTVIAGFRVPNPLTGFQVIEVSANGDAESIGRIDQSGEKYEVSVVVLNAVEVINVENTLEVVGTVAQDASQAGIANRGTYNITVAVEPDELTDLTYALQFGEELLLAVAVDGADNEDTPRAATVINNILGDDGVWVAEVEDGNLIDFLGGQDIAGSSIEIQAPDDDEESADESGDDEDDLEPGDS